MKAGAKPVPCGWIKNPLGLSWQIVPRRFTELLGDSNPTKVNAVLDAMMTMVKLELWNNVQTINNPDALRLLRLFWRRAQALVSGGSYGSQRATMQWLLAWQAQWPFSRTISCGNS
jgi:hypothetical protein